MMVPLLSRVDRAAAWKSSGFALGVSLGVTFHQRMSAEPAQSQSGISMNLIIDADNAV